MALETVTRDEVLVLFRNDLSKMDAQARASKARNLAVKHGLLQTKDPNDARKVLYSRSQVEGIVRPKTWITARAA